jgi:hypothetical protein
VTTADNLSGYVSRLSPPGGRMSARNSGSG